MSKRLVAVRGTCPAGHLLERDAELDGSGKPLLTWRGPCPAEGCTARVIARRIKGAPKTSPTPPKQEDTPPPATPPATAPARRTVRKVTAYRDAPSRAQPQRPAKVVDSKPAVVPATAPLPAIAKPGPDGRTPADPDLEQPSGRRRRRFSFGGPDARDSEGWTVPGIY